VEPCLCEEAERPFPGEDDDAEDEVYYLEKRERFNGGVEVLGEEVPEYFGPKETFDGGGYLI
jgi:hypothetical protein